MFYFVYVVIHIVYNIFSGGLKNEIPLRFSPWSLQMQGSMS